MPDIEQRFFSEYADDGLQVIAMNSRESLDEIGQVEDFVQSLGVTYLVGLEDEATPTYDALTQHYEGLNPFPTTVVVGRDGTIRFITREYNADALEAQVEAALAE